MLGAGAAILRAMGEKTHEDKAGLVTQALAPTALDLPIKPECKVKR